MKKAISVCLLVLLLLSLLAILFAKLVVVERDHAAAQVISSLAICIAWISLVFIIPIRAIRWFMLLTPLIASLLILGLYRLQLDGELGFTLSPRWARPSLPEVTSGNPATLELGLDRSDDWPGFWGKERNGVIDSIQLQPDWEKFPPKLVWKQPIGEGWSSFAIRGELAVTMEQRESEEWITAYNVNDGKLVWKQALPGRHASILGGVGPRSTPVIAGDSVVACSAIDSVVCLELLTGSMIWQSSLSTIGGFTQSDFETCVSWGRSGSPLATTSSHGNMVIVPMGGSNLQKNTLVALRLDNGQEAWRSGTDQISYSSPCLVNLHGIAQILYVSEQNLISVDPDTGEQLWNAPWSSSSAGDANTSQPVVIDNNRILITKGYQRGAKLLEVLFENGAWTISDVWVNETVLKTKFTSALHYQGYLYGLSDGILECVSLADGKSVWKKGR
ncbi:MAG: PQQ-binding-like beta-propeller repeat protein, partial [Planctomycetales bacterium]|nr:PQQ-binding-like beta-propeller repeat protein [Planctomycetales bacterium]